MSARELSYLARELSYLAKSFMNRLAVVRTGLLVNNARHYNVDLNIARLNLGKKFIIGLHGSLPTAPGT